MTDKELHRLGRRELLQLLLEQGREAEKTRQVLAETETELRQLQETYERLRKRLDHKDEQIHELNAILEAERTKREIEISESGSLAEAALRLNMIFDVAQKAADQYLYNIKRLHGGEGELPEVSELLAAQALETRQAEPLQRVTGMAGQAGTSRQADVAGQAETAVSEQKKDKAEEQQAGQRAASSFIGQETREASGNQKETEQEKAIAEAEKAEQEKAKAEAEKAEQEKAKAEAEKAEREKAIAEAKKVEQEKAKAETEQAEQEKARAEAEKAEREKAIAEAKKVEQEKARAEAEKARAEAEKAEREKARAEKEKAETKKTDPEEAELDDDPKVIRLEYVKAEKIRRAEAEAVQALQKASMIKGETPDGKELEAKSAGEQQTARAEAAGAEQTREAVGIKISESGMRSIVAELQPQKMKLKALPDLEENAMEVPDRQEKEEREKEAFQEAGQDAAVADEEQPAAAADTKVNTRKTAEKRTFFRQMGKFMKFKVR